LTAGAAVFLALAQTRELPGRLKAITHRDEDGKIFEIDSHGVPSPSAAKLRVPGPKATASHHVAADRSIAA
jgi:hypothetical protein